MKFKILELLEEQEGVSIERVDTFSVFFSVKEIYFKVDFREYISLITLEDDKEILNTPFSNISYLIIAINGVVSRYDEVEKLRSVLFEILRSNKVHKIIKLCNDKKSSISDVQDFIRKLNKDNFIIK